MRDRADFVAWALMLLDISSAHTRRVIPVWAQPKTGT
jgi:hypothetical protein